MKRERAALPCLSLLLWPVLCALFLGAFVAGSTDELWLDGATVENDSGFWNFLAPSPSTYGETCGDDPALDSLTAFGWGQEAETQLVRPEDFSMAALGLEDEGCLAAMQGSQGWQSGTLSAGQPRDTRHCQAALAKSAVFGGDCAISDEELSWQPSLHQLPSTLCSSFEMAVEDELLQVRGFSGSQELWTQPLQHPIGDPFPTRCDTLGEDSYFSGSSCLIKGALGVSTGALEEKQPATARPTGRPMETPFGGPAPPYPQVGKAMSEPGLPVMAMPAEGVCQPARLNFIRQLVRMGAYEAIEEVARLDLDALRVVLQVACERKTYQPRILCYLLQQGLAGRDDHGAAIWWAAIRNRDWALLEHLWNPAHYGEPPSQALVKEAILLLFHGLLKTWERRVGIRRPKGHRAVDGDQASGWTTEGLTSPQRNPSAEQTATWEEEDKPVKRWLREMTQSLDYPVISKILSIHLVSHLDRISRIPELYAVFNSLLVLGQQRRQQMPFLPHDVAFSLSQSSDQSIFDAYLLKDPTQAWLTEHLFYYFDPELMGRLRRSLEADPEAYRLMTGRVAKFYACYAMQRPPVYDAAGNLAAHLTMPGPEERFYANVLFDNYFWLFQDWRQAYTGSVDVRPSPPETSPVRQPRPAPRGPPAPGGPPAPEAAEEEPAVVFGGVQFVDFAHHFLVNFHAAWVAMERDGVLSETERFQMAELNRLLQDVHISGQRYLDPDVRANVEAHIRAMQVGETFCLDIYAMDLPGPGHLVLGILLRLPSGAFNLRLLNTGAQSYQSHMFPHRYDLYTDLVQVPEEVILGHYLNPLPSMKDIYLEQYLPLEVLPLPFEHTVRGQRGGTCSVRRLWALGRLILGGDLYQEVKTRFVLGCLHPLHDSFQAIVYDRWASPYPPAWLLATSSMLFERNLWFQSRRMKDGARAAAVRERILDSVGTRYRHASQAITRGFLDPWNELRAPCGRNPTPAATAAHPPAGAAPLRPPPTAYGATAHAHLVSQSTTPPPPHYPKGPLAGVGSAQEGGRPGRAKRPVDIANQMVLLRVDGPGPPLAGAASTANVREEHPSSLRRSRRRSPITKDPAIRLPSIAGIVKAEIRETHRHADRVHRQWPVSVPPPITMVSRVGENGN